MQFNFKNNILNLKVKKFPLAVRIIMFFFAFAFFVFPVLGAIIGAMTGTGLQFGYFIAIGLFALMIFYLLGVSLWNKNKNREENLELLESNYKSRTENGVLIMNINWKVDISQIDINFIKERIEIEDIDRFEENYLIEYLNIDQILNLMFEEEDSIEENFPRNQLIDDFKITRLIKYVEDGNHVCPPIIGYYTSYLGTEDFGIRDGNHRIALSRFLGIEQIPFIVHRNHIERIRGV